MINAQLHNTGHKLFKWQVHRQTRQNAMQSLPKYTLIKSFKHYHKTHMNTTWAIGHIFYHLNNKRLRFSSLLILTTRVSWYSTLWRTASNKRTWQSLVKKNLISSAEIELSQLWNHDWAQPSVFMGLAEVEAPQSASQ